MKVRLPFVGATLLAASFLGARALTLASSAPSAGGAFSMSKQTELADLLLDFSVHVTPKVSTLEPSGNLPAGSRIRVASYSGTLTRLVPEARELVNHTRGTRFLEIDGRGGVGASTSTFVERGELEGRPIFWSFAVDPKAGLTWADVESSEDLVFELVLREGE